MGDKNVTLFLQTRIVAVPLGKGSMQGGITAIDGKNYLAVQEINCSGDGSGHDVQMLYRWLRHSSGILLAVQVWEYGDSFSLIRAENGEVDMRDIDQNLFAQYRGDFE